MLLLVAVIVGALIGVGRPGQDRGRGQRHDRQDLGRQRGREHERRPGGATTPVAATRAVGTTPAAATTRAAATPRWQRQPRRRGRRRRRGLRGHGARHLRLLRQGLRLLPEGVRPRALLRRDAPGRGARPRSTTPPRRSSAPVCGRATPATRPSSTRAPRRSTSTSRRSRPPTTRSSRALNNTKKLFDPRFKDAEAINKALQELRGKTPTVPPPAPNGASGAPKTPTAASKVLKGLSKFGKGLGVVGAGDRRLQQHQERRRSARA